MFVRDGNGQLSPESATALDQLCEGARERGGEPLARSDLRSLARALAAGAKAAGMFPERMVMEVRARWRVEFRSADYAGRERGETTLSELLSLCIDEYFADVAPRAKATPPRPEMGTNDGAAPPR